MKIENEQLSLTISAYAAEMHSLIDKQDAKEILWQGDPAFWAGRNPILFPIIGSTFDKKIHLFDRIYEMGNHGFARHSEFEFTAATSDSISLRLKDSEATMEQYPFHFELDVKYTLIKNKVMIDYEIVNLDEKAMPFSLGLHPAFALDDADSAVVSFPCQEQDPVVVSNRNLVAMNDAFFANIPTFLMEYPASPYVELIRGDKSIRVGCVGYRWLAFWKKPGAKYLCIEPWHGHTDHGEATTDFYIREGTIVLQPRQTYKTSYFIEINS